MAIIFQMCCRKDCVEYLNLVFGATEESSTYWNTTLKKAVEKKFTFSTTIALREETNLKHYIFNIGTSADGRLLMLKRLLEMTGLRLDNRFMEHFARKPKQIDKRRTFLEEEHLVEVGERIKSMSIISHAQGYLLKVKGVEQGSVYHLKVHTFS